jgi:hypothetical protein
MYAQSIRGARSAFAESPLSPLRLPISLFRLAFIQAVTTRTAAEEEKVDRKEGYRM